MILSPRFHLRKTRKEPSCGWETVTVRQIPKLVKDFYVTSLLPVMFILPFWMSACQHKKGKTNCQECFLVLSETGQCVAVMPILNYREDPSSVFTAKQKDAKEEEYVWSCQSLVIPIPHHHVRYFCLVK